MREELKEIENFSYRHLIETILIIMLIAIGSISIIFYPSPQSSISEGFVILITLIIFYLKNKFVKLI